METFLCKHSLFIKEFNELFTESLSLNILDTLFDFDVKDCIMSLYNLSFDIFDISLFIKLDKLPYISIRDKDYEYIQQMEEISNYLMIDKRIHSKIEVCLILMDHYEYFSSIKSLLNNIYLPKEIIVQHDQLVLDWCLKAGYHTHSDNYLYHVCFESDNVESLKILHKSQKMPEFQKNDLYFAKIYNAKKCISYLRENKCPSYSSYRITGRYTPA